ncbi:Y-family DNA polymerase [Rhizobium sp. GN54]|uniref:Y-family DNA polymerase n=1 Tax=Rhizobium sp. GN54 TaxID=2898150 RepID=UPI001E5C8AFE|nr:DNA polymerase Y family protein [Rhizobium sp. GN54]MCD2182622.1 DNA polymerase Y family protein [Rhizobium sp. GN54]
MARARWGRSWLSRGRPDHPPVAFAGRSGTAVQIAFLDREAERTGLRKGQGVTEARAICPSLDVLPADPAADRTLLEALADWCDRYTPLVALDGDDGLHLDITGCTHLHGGERALLDGVLSSLFALGIEARGAISSSVGLSWAAAHFGDGGVIDPDAARETLAPLPVAALRLPEEVVGPLGRVGLKTVGDLFPLPRAPLARRFGPLPLLRLDQALGLEDEPVSPRLPVPMLSAERRLFDTVRSEDDILALAAHLAGTLREGLERRGEGGRLFALLLFRVDGRVFRIHAATSTPLRDPHRIALVFRERLAAVHDDLDAGYGFEIVRLCVLRSEVFETVQEGFSARTDADRSLSAFAERVVARFGPESLLAVTLPESHVPERAARLVSVRDLWEDGGAAAETLAASTSPEGRPPSSLSLGDRPLRLFTPPEPVETVAGVPEDAPKTFRWRRSFHRITRTEGPERIAAEWWIDGEDHPSRDYFRVEDDAGRRYWLFREGIYRDDAALPRWFIHGVFA